MTEMNPAKGEAGRANEPTDFDLAQAGFQLCEMGDECDFCHSEAPLGDYFWRRTSYEYVEGDYYCRSCAIKEMNQ